MATNNAVNTSLSGQSGTGAFAGTTSPSFTTPVLGTPTSGTLTNCTGLLLAGGGTSANLTANDGGIVYSTATAMAILSGTATANKMLLSGATAAPTWSTSTIPSSAGATAGKALVSDGTNYVLSSAAFPTSVGATGTILRSDGTNWVATTSTYPNTNAVSTLLYASASNVMSALATANSAGLLTDSGGVPAWVTATGTGAPVLATSPTLITPTLGVATATSINFGGSALNTYTELTSWTPAVTFATPGDVSVSYSSRTGYYSRVGNIVSAHFAITGANPTFTTASGNLQITGLPFSANTNIGAMGSCQFQSSTFPAGTTSIYLRLAANTSAILVGTSGSAVAAAFMTTTQVLTGVNISMVGSITYLV